MTGGREDYLKALYYLGEKQDRVTNKELAQTLHVSSPSVSEMVNRLYKEGYIDYIAYKGSRLTPSGMELALSVTRSHRLWEVFLTEYLHYTWSEAHEEAHLLEHCTSKRLACRLDAYLQHPVFCPHGSFIPPADGVPTVRRLRPLSSLTEGETSHIRKRTEETELMDYLQEEGIYIGMKITLEKSGKYEGPLLLKTAKRSILLSYKAAAKIFVDLP